MTHKEMNDIINDKILSIVGKKLVTLGKANLPIS
jgi:hypothetical protein